MGTTIVYSRSMLKACEEFCQRRAEYNRLMRTTLVREKHGEFFVPVAENSFSQLLSVLGELFWEFLAGFLNGIAAGYASHLALDALTPHSIPLLARGF
jgi:hypothetical protein